ncbi:hypothetical protein EDD11_004969 [Mortierella claussenii]|nr:hypothetical protein EDD11_004969 [Mortierella claussenii]
MRATIVGKPGQELRRNYVQQYLKQLLRKVHPDLFQHHPKEQLQNSTSLQDLLPLVGHDNNKNKSAQISSHSSPSSSSSSLEGKPMKLVFYFKPKHVGISAGTTHASPGQLESVEHTFPNLGIRTSSEGRSDGGSLGPLEQEVKAWQTVQSFLELCRKLGISVKEPDQQDVARYLELSIQEAEDKSRSAQKRAPQKPLSEIFQEELQDSFAGSVGHSTPAASASVLHGLSANSPITQGDVSQVQLGKIGGVAPKLDAQVMIQSNPLLFKSPELSAAKLGKVVRTWIHWLEEDRLSSSTSSPAEGTHIARTRFSLVNWWRKVPVMVLSSAREQEEASKAAVASNKGMLIVHPGMSKQDMVEYLQSNLARVQHEYKDMLQAALSRRSPSAPSLSSFNHQQHQHPQQYHRQGQTGSPFVLSSEAASYLDRMRAKAQLQHVKSRSSGDRLGRTGWK